MNRAVVSIGKYRQSESRDHWEMAFDDCVSPTKSGLGFHREMRGTDMATTVRVSYNVGLNVRNMHIVAF